MIKLRLLQGTRHGRGYGTPYGYGTMGLGGQGGYGEAKVMNAGMDSTEMDYRWPLGRSPGYGRDVGVPSLENGKYLWEWYE